MASPSLSISTSTTLLASDEEEPLLPSDEEQPPTIQFTNLKDLYQMIDQVSGDILIVHNVSPPDFEKLTRQERRRFRLRRYNRDREILIVTIPTPLHEALHLGLYEEIRDQIKPPRKEIWKSIGSTTFRPRGHPGGDGGEGDSCGGPKPTRECKGAWPTLVVEAGCSESLGALRDDMRWWFSASEHQVKIVILTKFDYLRQRIIIERWEEDYFQTRPGATMTRSAATSNTVQPVLRQSISITRDLSTNTYYVARGALVLSFPLLFQRDPGPQEGDIIISIADLQAYAQDVWQDV